MTSYTDIPIEIERRRLTATFEFVPTSDNSHSCIINIDDRVMVIDEAFLIKNGNVPKEWIQPIVDKLQELIRKQ